MVDLLVLISLDQLLFILKVLLTSFTKQANLNEEVNGTEPSPFVSIPCLNPTRKYKTML
jgi:hypothetical protein